MSTKIIEIERRVAAFANQYLKYEVNAADWDRYLAEAEGDWTEAVHALKDAKLLTFIEYEHELDEILEVYDEQFMLSDGEN